MTEEDTTDEDHVEPLSPEDLLESDWSITSRVTTDTDITSALSTAIKDRICSQPHAFTQIHSLEAELEVEIASVQAISADSTNSIRV